MKIFTQVNRSQGMIRTLVGLKSRITSTKPLLSMLALLMVCLFGVNEKALALRYGRAKAYSSPVAGGWVWVTKTNGNAPSKWEKTDDESSDDNKKISDWTFPFYYYANAQTNYTFLGWATSSSTNTTVSTTQTNWYVGVTATSANNVYWNYATVERWALFGRLTANKSSETFGSVNVGSTSSAKEVKVTYVHAGKVTATLTGDFSFESGSSSKSKTLAESNTDSEVTDQSIYIYFKPTCNSTRNGKLTIKSSSNGLTDVEVNLSGTGTLNSQTLSWNNESQINLNMLTGTTQNISASATSGLTVSYESSNTDVLSVDANGKLTAKAVGGPVTITAKQAGDCTYSAATSITKTFNVKTKDTPFFTPNGFSEETTNALKVDDEVTLGVSYVSDGLNGDFRASATKVNNQDILQITRNGNTITIKALREGTSTITFTQTENSTIFGATKSYTFNVTKVDNTLGVKNTSYSRYVEEDDDLTSFVTTNSNGTIHTSSTVAGIAHYDIANNAIVIDNSSNTSFNSTSVTIKIWQDATVKYAGIAEANAKTVTLTVKKYDNKLYAHGSENYAPSMYTDKTIESVTLTADNTDYTNSPISVSQSTDPTIASYNKGTGVITSYQNLGTASWTISQPENYKYKAGNGSFTVNVIKKSEGSCYTYESTFGGKTAQELADMGTIDLNGIGGVLTLQMHYNGTVWGNEAILYMSADGNNWSEKEIGTDTKGYSDIDPVNLPDGTRYIKFSKSDSDNPYIRNIKVTRVSYLNIGTDSEKGVATINKTLTINTKDGTQAIYPSETGQQATTVYWSVINGGNLKIKCDDSRFTFSQNTITGVDCNSGATDITVYFTSTEEGTVTATATVYNDVYNQTFTVKGVVEYADQAITWNKEVLSIDNSYTGVASASSTNRVTYYSPNESIIRVDEDEDGYKTILTAVGTGNVEITATAEGDNFYAEKVSKKTIQVTDKLIQWIEWNQPLFGLKLGGANETLTAVATSAVEGCSSSRLIEYTSSDESVVKVVNFNQLQIIGVGTAYVTATQAGGVDSDGHDYEATSTEKKVIVRDPNAPCESYVYQQAEEVRFDLGWNHADKQTRSQEIKFNGKVPGACTFRYKGEHKTVWPATYYDGTMYVEEFYEGAWHLVENGNLGKPTKSSYNTANLMLDRRSTKMRIVASNGLGYHYFTDCQVEQARFIETTAPVAFNANVGQIVPQDIYLSYSNITDNLSLTMNQGANSHFSVDKTSIEGSCGDYANNVKLTISYHSDAEETNAQDKLIITDGTTTCEVTLTGNASRVNQHINWDHADETDVYTVHTETLSAEARTDLDKKASDVAFSFASNSTATGNISTENVLSFTSAGVANIVAHTANSNLYFPATNVVKHWNVSLTPTQISTLPNIGEITSGTAANAIDLTGWQATNTVNSGVVGGTLSITAGDLTTVGTNTITLHFAPDNTNMYSPCDRTMSVTVVQRPATNDEIGTLTAGPVIYGQKLSDADLSLSGSLKGQGTFTWTDSRKDNVENVGTYNNLQVRFTPNNKNIAPKDLTVNVMVNKMETLNVPVELAFCPGSSEWYRGTEYTEAGTYPFNAEGVNRDTVYNVTVTVLQPTTGTDSKTITVGAEETWNGINLSGYAVGSHSVVAVLTNAAGCDSTVTLTLTVEKIETLDVPVELSFCPGSSETFHGITYTEAGSDVIEATGATRDTVYNVTVTILQPTVGADSKTITVGAEETWNGINLSGYAVGEHSVVAVLTNAAGCDSTVTLTLTVEKIETLNVPVELSFCAGGSETFHGRTYTEAGSDVIEATGATRDTVYNVTVTILQPTTGTDSKTITVGAEETWNGTDLSGYAVGEHSVVAVLTNAAGCDSTVTLTLTVNPLINEFTNATGDGDWNNNANWSSGAKPTEDAPNVIIQDTLTIDENITVGDLTIEKGATVLIVTGGTLTVTGETEYREAGYGDIHVKDDGALELESTAVLEVRHFTLDAKLGDVSDDTKKGASGQVDGTEQLSVNGEVYFDLQLDPGTRATYGWYTFTVPFEVNVVGGIYRLNNDGSMTLYKAGKDFIVMRYDEAKRARGEKGWVKLNSGVLHAGIGYNITVDDEVEQNVLRFVWNKNNTFGASYSCPLQLSESTTDKAGWNGLGNGTLTHTQLNDLDDEVKVQMYDHESNTFIGVYANEFTYAVGTAFFYQAENTDPLVLTQADGSRVLRAPQREGQRVGEFQLSLTEDGTENKSDLMYVSADEEATGEYRVGRDLLKMSNPTEANVAQMWSERNGLKLCDIEMQLMGSSATCELGLYAPKAGSYTLDVERAPENTMLYLTYNGRAIWNLTYSPYVFDLTKGTTEGYGLKMYVMQVATDIEQSGFSDQNSVRKVLIDDVIYIVTQDGKMYDITGKSANY